MFSIFLVIIRMRGAANVGHSPFPIITQTKHLVDHNTQELRESQVEKIKTSTARATEVSSMFGR